MSLAAPTAADLRLLSREVVDLAWPAIVAGLVSTAVFFTDRLMLGRYDAVALGSMQVSGPVLWSMHSVFGAFSAGTLAVVGRSVGAGSAGAARRTTVATLAFAAVIGALVGAAGWLGAPAIATAMVGAADSAIHAPAVGYMRIVFAASPLVFFAQAATVAMQASGDTRTPMRVGALAGAVNLVVSAVLLFGLGGAPELGVRGAALGTAAAFLVQGLALGGLLLERTPAADIWAGLSRLGERMAPVLRIAGPAFGEKLIFHAGFLAFAAIVGRLGPAATAANQSLIAIESVGFIAASGFGVASGALVAQKLGARRPADAAACGWLSAGIGGGALGLVSLLFLVFPEVLVGLFSTDPDVVALGARCLRVAAIAQPLMAIADALAGGLRGAGDTRSPMRVALVGPVLVRLTACWVLAVELDLGLLGIWLGTTLDWAVRVVWLAAIFRRGAWRDLAPADSGA